MKEQLIMWSFSTRTECESSSLVFNSRLFPLREVSADLICCGHVREVMPHYVPVARLRGIPYLMQARLSAKCPI